jgi:uncharacterized YigZ family protein
VTDDGADDAVRTVAKPTRVEIEKIKGSRFICDLAPAADEASALAVVDGIRSLEPTATHHCWAYRLGTGRVRSSDDGEPGGTAGPPILRRLESAGISDVVAVVTRYYGGTNLGTGGLIRAYGAATAAAIAAADTVTRPRTVGFRLSHPYDLSAAIDGVLAANGAEVTSSRYAAAVTLEVLVPAANAESFTAAIREATSGAVTAMLIEVRDTAP